MLRVQNEKERNRTGDFPVQYGDWVLEELQKFNYQTLFLAQKYSFDLEQKSIEQQTVASKKRAFIKLERHSINNAKAKARRIQNICEELSLEEISILEEYHFYISKDKNKFASELKTITENQNFTDLIEKILMGCFVLRVENNAMINRQDSFTRQTIKTKIRNQLKPILDATVTNLNPLQIKTEVIVRVIENETDALKEKMKSLDIAKNIVKRIEQNCIKFSEEQFSSLIAYHVLKNNKQMTTKLKTIIEGSAFIEAREIVADCTVLAKTKNIGSISKQDSITQGAIKLKIRNEFIEKWNSATANLESLYINTNTINVGEISRNAIKTRKESLDKEKEIKKRKLFLVKAKKAGLDKAKIQEVLLLIEERNTAIESYIKSRGSNEDSGLFSLTETAEVKKPHIIKKEFAEKLTEILSYKEFALLIGNDFEKKSIKQATEELNVLQGDKELTEKQSKKLYQLVFNYYHNQNITKAYYNHDRQLSKQKLGVLSYRFEKEYQALTKKLKLDLGNSKKKDNKTFQWN